MNINITLIGQLITFILFVIFTMKLVWPPIMRALKERQQKIAEGLAAAKQGERELEIAERKAKAIITEAREQASVIIKQANHRAHQIDEQAQLDARNLAEHMRRHAEEEIAQKMNSAQEQLQQHVIELTLQATGKLLRREVNQAYNDELAKELAGEFRA